MNTTLYLIAAYVLGLGILVAYGISVWAQLNKTKDLGRGDGSES